MNDGNETTDAKDPIAEAIGAAEEITDPLDGLIERSAANPGAAFTLEVLERLAALKKDDRAAFELLRSKLKKAGCRVTALDEAIAEESGDVGGRGPTQADILVDLAQTAELFHAPQGTGFADVDIHGHREPFSRKPVAHPVRRRCKISQCLRRRRLNHLEREARRSRLQPTACLLLGLIEKFSLLPPCAQEVTRPRQLAKKRRFFWRSGREPVWLALKLRQHRQNAIGKSAMYFKAKMAFGAKYVADEIPVNADTLRRQISVWAILAIAALMAACASRPETGFLSPVSETAAGASEHTMLVATTRERDGRPGTLFNGERAQPLDYAKIAVSVPQKHVAGEIEWASSAPGNPETNFVVRQAAYLDGEKEFISTLNAQLAMRPRGKRKVLIFIHGYNTMFAEGLYRFAQIVHDSNSPAVPVLFTWASRGQLSDYVYDNNSATAARDELERTIRLAFASDADQINILAHSMGNWVTVEALRQIKITGGLPQIAKLGSIFLAAPDIDVDVFKSQMRRFGKPRKPFYIVLSKDDQALRASSFLAGKDSRLGSDGNTAELNTLGAVVIDLTDVKANDSSNHGKFAQLAEIAPQLTAVLEKGISTNADSASQGQQPAGGTLAAIVTAPLKILGAPIKIIAGR